LTDATKGAVIYYTTNGAIPTASSTKYTGAIVVSQTTTIQAIAVASGYANSAVASASYTFILPAATPVLSPNGGTYAAGQSITLTDATKGAVIFYTTNGATPTAQSTKYSAAIKVSATETIQAIAVASGYANSAAASATYTIK
jgi:predicted P-loop ATPase/GTPase